MTSSRVAAAAAPVPVSTAAADVARDRILARVEDRLRRLLDGERRRWSAVDARGAVPVEAVAALLDAGGKRIRPAFCVSGYLAAGGDPDDPTIVDVAAGLELLHACALIHDDVMDESTLRRGAPTVHIRYAAEHAARGWWGDARRFGENVAILAGDLALVYADNLLHGAPAPALEVWAELRGELIIGQYLDVAVAAELVADESLTRWVALCKSGRYTIHRPLVLGVTLAGRPGLAAAFEEYGLRTGEAFQLRDDLIDAFGVTEVSGKPVGLDLEQHKMTLLLALAINRDERVRAMVDRREGIDAARLRELLIDAGIRAEVEARIDRLVEQACRALDDAPLDEHWRRQLTAMAVRVAYRTT
jgi:geranylgeranyl diphosphate synthase, type I